MNLINAAPIGFQIHVMLAWVLFAAWPFTRLVHVFSAPVGYLTRPYIVYRSRADRMPSARPGAAGSRSGAPADDPPVVRGKGAPSR